MGSPLWYSLLWLFCCIVFCSLFSETLFAAMVFWDSYLRSLFYGRMAWDDWTIATGCLLFSERETVYRVLITDAPQPKEHTYLCQALLKERRDTAGIYPIGHTAVLYLQQDSSASRLKSGDELLISARISPPLNNRNFDEFDYARFLMRKGISGTGYVASGKWTKQDGMNNLDLKV